MLEYAGLLVSLSRYVFCYLSFIYSSNTIFYSVYFVFFFFFHGYYWMDTLNIADPPPYRFGWLCFTSHRHRGHLDTAPPFTVPCEGREAR